MSVKEKLEVLIKQARLFYTQGLYEESKTKYEEAFSLVDRTNSKSKEKLLKQIKDKIGKVSHTINEVEAADNFVTDLPDEIRDLIRNNFVKTGDEYMDKLEGNLALAKFGQTAAALDGFRELIDKPNVGLDAAKNILRIHMNEGTLNEAIEEYKTWGYLFDDTDKEKLSLFFQAALDKANYPYDPSSLGFDEECEIEEVIEGPRIDEDEIPDVNYFKKDDFEIDVTFQNKNILSFLVEGRDKKLLERMELDRVYEDVEFFSPIAIFGGSFKVMKRNRIPSGPRRGDYSIDVKVTL